MNYTLLEDAKLILVARHLINIKLAHWIKATKIALKK